MTFELTIQPYQGSPTRIQVDPTMTLDEVRQQLLQVRNYPMCQPTEFFFQRKPLKNNAVTLESVGIREATTLHVVFKLGFNLDIQVPSEFSREVITIVAGETMTIGEVKLEILKKTGILLKRQDLYFGGNLLENDLATLENSGLTKGGSLQLQVLPRQPSAGIPQPSPSSASPAPM